jgi:WD40 repeat protein
VTGSADHLVRLWNPYCPQKPTTLLQGHVTGVLAVKIYFDLGKMFSYSKDATLKVWDTNDQVCLQTLSLKFPSALFGRLPEHGSFPISLLAAPANVLLITCTDYIAKLRLT